MNQCKFVTEESPTVSVCVVTYNQEKYIRECLRSLVDQDCDFNFEIIVGDDASTDKTAEIISDFSENYKGVIFSVLRSENIGAVENIVDLYKRARGRYIAHMDGDDFALPGKIQSQVDALEANHDCVICTHDVILVDKNSKKIADSFKKHRCGTSTLQDLYASLPFFAHSSKMFVNDASSPFYDRLSKFSIDIEIHIEQAKNGNIFHLEERFGAYRVFTGISSNNRKINNLLPEATRRIFKEAIFHKQSGDVSELKGFYANAMLNYSYQGAVNGSYADFVRYALESVSIKLISVKQIGMLFLVLLPPVAIGAAKLRNYWKYNLKLL